MIKYRWTHNDNGWNVSWQIWRCQIRFHVFRHTYQTLSDRWVFQAHFVYDRKEPAPIVFESALDINSRYPQDLLNKIEGDAENESHS